MPSQDQDRVVVNRRTAREYSTVNIPETNFGEVESLRKSLGREVTARSSGRVSFKAPTTRIMAQAYVRCGDMQTLRLAVMQTANL